MGIKSFLSSLFNSEPRPQQQVSRPQPAVRRERSEKEWVDYFREILATEFGQYEIRENVPVQDLVGFANDEFKLYRSRPQQAYRAEWGQPYTFVLFQNGLVYGVVMLGSGHSHDSLMRYLVSRMYAKKMNVPYINFYTQMPNERNYVIGRIRSMMHLA